MKQDFELDPDHCSINRAGHCFDLAEAKLEWRYGRPSPISVRIIEVQGDGRLVVADEAGMRYRLWCRFFPGSSDDRSLLHLLQLGPNTPDFSLTD